MKKAWSKRASVFGSATATTTAAASGIDPVTSEATKKVKRRFPKRVLTALLAVLLVVAISATALADWWPALTNPAKGGFTKQTQAIDCKAAAVANALDIITGKNYCDGDVGVWTWSQKKKMYYWQFSSSKASRTIASKGHENIVSFGGLSHEKDIRYATVHTACRALCLWKDNTCGEDNNRNDHPGNNTDSQHRRNSY